MTAEVHTGFEEISHTADCAIRVWAPDMPTLLAEAARGMVVVSGAGLENGPRLRKTMSLQFTDLEGLLVAFLTELVFAQEHDGVGFDQFQLSISGNRLTGVLEGAPLASLAKPIKAVTYHNLKIVHTSRGREVEIVFDV